MPGAQSRFPLGRVALVWAVLCLVALLVNAGNIAARHFPDPDDTLRLVEVRDLLAGQGWFDLHQYRIDPPHGTLMHWSRLVDLPLAAVIAGLTPLFGSSAAEMAALVLIPLLTLGVILQIVARVSSRFFDIEVTTFACLALGLAPLLVAQLQPLRIDHHGWQVASVMAALLGLLPGRRWRGAVVSGVALAFGLSISLEVLPLMAGFGAVFALRWLLIRDRHSLPAFLGALAGTVGGLFLATRGLADVAVHCDQVSPPHMALLAVVAGLTLGVARYASRSLLVQIVLLGTSAGASLALFLALAPQCASGPFGQLDPLVRHFWYDNVLEGRPAWTMPPLMAVPVVLSGLVSLAVLAHLARSRTVEERQWWLEYLAVSAVAFVAAILVWRSQAFVGALAAVPLGWLAVRLLARLREARTPSRKLAAALTVVLVLLPGFPTALAGALVPENTVNTGKMSKITDSACDVAHSASALDGLPAGTVFAPLDIGPAIVERSHHAVVATGHHRAAPAMHDVIAAFTLPEAQAHGLVAKHGAQYLVLCTDVAETRLFAQAAPHGLAAELIGGRAPAWLQRIALPVPAPMQVWRVVS
jgi:hypothetical protein